MTYLEKIIADLVERKKALPLDSAEYQLINRMLTNLRTKHAAELEERELRKLDPRRQDLVRRIAEGHPETKWDSEALQRLHNDLDEWGSRTTTRFSVLIDSARKTAPRCQVSWR
jgi:hypothetical protein